MIGSADLEAEPDGATPLGPDELAGLIPTWVHNRAELNEVEQENVTDAMIWAYGQKWTVDSLMTSNAMRQLHRRMFEDVWKWAGEYRRRETTIGVALSQIAVQLRDLLEDVRAQAGAREAVGWSADEIAIRFHHRLVRVHPFPNGNGRQARLAADLLAIALGARQFTWGGANLTGEGEARSAYFAALRVADRTFEYGPLLAFARS